MHYSRYAFAKNRSKPTIITKNGAEIGQRKGFAPQDIQEIRKLYGCKKNMQESTQPSQEPTRQYSQEQTQPSLKTTQKPTLISQEPTQQSTQLDSTTELPAQTPLHKTTKQPEPLVTTRSNDTQPSQKTTQPSMQEVTKPYRQQLLDGTTQQPVQPSQEPTKQPGLFETTKAKDTQHLTKPIQQPSKELTQKPMVTAKHNATVQLTSVPGQQSTTWEYRQQPTKEPTQQPIKQPDPYFTTIPSNKEEFTSKPKEITTTNDYNLNDFSTATNNKCESGHIIAGVCSSANSRFQSTFQVFMICAPYFVIYLVQK